MCTSSFLRHGGSLGKRGRGSARRPCQLASPFSEKDCKSAPRCMLTWKPVLLGHSFKQDTAFKKANRPFFRPVYLLSLQCALEDGGQEFFLFVYSSVGPTDTNPTGHQSQMIREEGVPRVEAAKTKALDLWTSSFLKGGRVKVKVASASLCSLWRGLQSVPRCVSN